MRTARLTAGLLLGGGLLAVLLLPPGERTLGSYVTSLRSRTSGQRANAVRAARAIDGTLIETGHEFSFNQAVGPWTRDRGYVLAPVSYDGELVVDWGGGVCQTASTLYNAALIAGLDVLERHRHTSAPLYVPPGRDAAVAQYTIDLRLRNPYPWPVRIRAPASDQTLAFKIVGPEGGPMAIVEAQPVGTVEPTEVARADADLRPEQRRVTTRGRPGVRVSVYRTRLHGPQAGRRELVSQDSYPAMNRVVRAGSRG